MVTALIVDKIPPRVTCPPDITVDCRFDWDPNNLDVFGSIVLADSLRKDIVIDSDTVMFDGPAIDGVAYDNCPMVVLDSMSMDSIDQCGEGVLRRYFQVEDAQGQMSPLCVQRITFVNPRPFNELDIIWPRDIDTVNVCSDVFFNPDFLEEEFAYPRYKYEAECSLVGHTYKDHIIDNTGGARGCFKILRKWKVIDWCQFDGREFEAWEHEQVILVENNRPPTITTECADTVHCFFTNDCIAPPITLTENALDDCTPRDQLFWTYKIDLGNDGSFDDEQSGSNTLTRSFPADTHRIKWIVEDLCGNEATCEYTFELRNCKAPIAYCKPGAILELTPMDLDGDGTPDTEMAELWASDLDDGSSHECGYGVTFSFSPDTSDNVRWYDCDSIGLRTVRIYVTDLTNGNQSVCITSVTIQDNNNVNVCPQTLNGSIAGLVADREGRAVALAEVTLPGTNMPLEMTGANGAYTFQDMPFGGSYNVEVHKDDDYLNGVTTGDLVRMQRHLLGMNTFTEPWQHIAGDVNFSGEVTASDIADVRRVILGVKEKFASERSWRFIDGEYQFQDPSDPLKEVLPEVIEISSFDDDVMNNWKGVKLGDIDNSADPQGFGGVSSRSAVALHYEDAVVDKYDEVSLVIQADHLEMVDAVQFTLEVDNDYFEILEVIPVQEGMHYAHFNQSMQHLGILSVSWDNIYRAEVNNLFIVRLRAVRNAEISDAVVMTNSVTDAIATIDEQDLNLQLKAVSSTGAEAGEVVLYQNEPNPWSTSTELSFFLPERRTVQLSIIDANGRVVWTLDRDYTKGFHEVQIDKGDLKASGVYYYQIQTGDFIASKKMLIL
jgi:hypothetical protein